MYKFLIVGKADGCAPKYWTGRTIGRWPVYSRDRSLACEHADRDLMADFAVGFRKLFAEQPAYIWAVERA